LKPNRSSREGLGEAEDLNINRGLFAKDPNAESLSLNIQDGKFCGEILLVSSQYLYANSEC
jgi:hypothetical protein